MNKFYGRENDLFIVRLRKLMRKKKYTHASLAEKLGVSRTTVSLWCIGDVYPTAEHMFKLCEVLEVSIDWLFWEGFKI